MTNRYLSIRSLVGSLALMMLLFGGQVSGQPSPDLQPLPPLKAPPSEQVELGKLLFFDKRMSGDADIRCSQCHDPRQAWTDGIPLSDGYPGTKYFRNTKTVLNVAYSDVLYWDGRMDGGKGDLDSQVRDALTESYWHAMDGRIMLQRWKQVPEYVQRFKAVYNAEPDFELTLKAVSAFMRSLVSQNVPLDKYLRGDQGAISEPARQGLALFQGKAGCIQCHNGAYLSDQTPHALGVPENPYVFLTPKRHISYRAVLRNLGVPNRMKWLEDVGYFAVSKNRQDIGKFITPSLREVARTAPYMHNGMLPTLEAVVDFYDQGGGSHPHKDRLLKSLGLSQAEKVALVEFLKTLSGDEIIPPDLERLMDQKQLPPYERYEWLKVQN